jgi:hypothetical protein
MTWELGNKLNFYVPYIALFIVENFLIMSATAFNFFADVGDSSKKYKMAIFKPKPSKFLIF